MTTPSQLATPSQLEMGTSQSPSPSTTPPPPRYDRLHHHRGDGGDHEASGISTPRDKEFSPTIWGIKRRMFWTIVAIGTLVVVSAVGVGVGAGIAFNIRENGVAD